MYASTVVYLVCSFLVFFFTSLAVVPQFHVERIGIFMHAFWVGGGCLLHFLNGIIWKNDALNRAPVFCDITVYFYMGMHGGTISTTLCILRRLHILLDLTSRTPSAQEKRRMIIMDLLITLGIPMVYMGLYYVNAGHRANIFEEIGCTTARYNTIVDITTMLITALILAVISMMYGVRNLIKIRKIYSEMRATEYFNADETANRYFRIMALSSVDLFLTIPFLIYMIVYATKWRLPWKSWADTKIRFSRIDSVPSADWRSHSSSLVGMELYRWTPVMASFVWLIFFGYTNETRRLYGPILRRIWDSTPFATPRPPLEPLTFVSASAHPRRQGEISDFSGFSTNRSDEDVQAPTVITPQVPLDVESQAERKGQGPGGRSNAGRKLWFKGATRP